MSRVACIYTSLPDEDAAAALVRALLERRLVACGNLFPVRSVYRWKGKLEDATETAVLLKARASALDRVFAAVRELHPYEVPCIEEWDVDKVHAPYAEWVLAETRGAARASKKRPSKKTPRARKRGAGRT